MAGLVGLLALATSTIDATWGRADITEGKMGESRRLPVSSIGPTLLPCLLRLIINACSRPLPLVKTTMVWARISSSMINSIIGLGWDGFEA